MQQQTQESLELVTRSISRAVDIRIAQDLEVTEDTLTRWVASENLDLFISVELPNGDVITTGSKIEGDTFNTTQVSGTNAYVIVSVAASALFWRSAYVVILVIVASLTALTVAAFFANWQAKRIADPLVYLAASAGVLGTGQTPSHEDTRSGIEEIDLVAQELVRSGERVTARIAAERQFAANASHQLRTPLTALSMRLEEIEMLSEDPEVQAEAQASLAQIERMVAVVDDLLKTARRSDGGTTEAVDLSEIFAQQATEWTPTYERAGRELVFSPTTEEALATPGALAQVISTLLENSLKYGDGTTTVKVRPRQPTDNSVVLEVADEGEGVTDELAPMIFERHVTAGKGSGLGLDLARALITADGGRLELAQRRPAVFAIFLSAVPSRLDPDQVLPPGAFIVVGRRNRRRR